MRNLSKEEVSSELDEMIEKSLCRIKGKYGVQPRVTKTEDEANWYYSADDGRWVLVTVVLDGVDTYVVITTCDRDSHNGCIERIVVRFATEHEIYECIAERFDKLAPAAV